VAADYPADAARPVGIVLTAGHSTAAELAEGVLREPQLSNLVRRRIVSADHPGLFILTASAAPADDSTRQTGAGRFLRISQLIAAVSRNIASQANYTTLANDVRKVVSAIIAETVAAYIGVLERLFVVERQLAWTPGPRSRARLRTSAKSHLTDPSLATAAMGVTFERLKADPNTTGRLFESAAFHDLTVYASVLCGQVPHSRDSNGHEIDAVIVLPDGRWAG
jgi:hypothetical protein